MKREKRAWLWLTSAVLLLFLFSVLSVRRLNANAGGSWSARDMWRYALDTWSGRGNQCANGLKQIALAEYEPTNDETAKDDDGFRFPDDRGGKILSKLLPPSEKASPAAHDAPAPRHLPPPVHLEKPTLPLPPGQADMPRLPAGKPQSLRPRPLPEELPLVGHQTDPLVPQVQYLHAGDRVRLHSVDVNQPIPLPILAGPLTDRAPLEDVTSDASLAAALAAKPPARVTPAPFLKLNLPDPFENRLKLPIAPAEEVTPTHTGSRPAR